MLRSPLHPYLSNPVTWMAPRLLAKFKDTVSIVGSVIVDGFTALNSDTPGTSGAGEAKIGRVIPHWLVHASLQDIPWLRSSDGISYNPKSATFAFGKATLEDVLVWTWISLCRVRFIPHRAIHRTVHPSDTRHFVEFCHALMYNIPTLL